MKNQSISYIQFYIAYIWENTHASNAQTEIVFTSRKFETTGKMLQYGSHSRIQYNVGNVI